MNPIMRTYFDANQPVSAMQIAQALDITRQAVYERHKRAEIHVSAWVRGANGHPVALFELGTGRDAPRPKARTQYQRNREYQTRNAAILRARRPSKRYMGMGVWRGLA